MGWSSLLLGVVFLFGVKGEASYNVFVTDAILGNFDPEFFGESCDCEMVEFNETYNAVNAKLEVLQDFSNEVELNYEGYKKDNGEYVPAGVSYQATLCEALKSDFLWSILKYFGLPEACPIDKKDYVMENYIVDKAHLPSDYMGIHEWKYDISLIYHSEQIVQFTIFFTIED